MQTLLKSAICILGSRLFLHQTVTCSAQVREIVINSFYIMYLLCCLSAITYAVLLVKMKYFNARTTAALLSIYH